MCGVIGLLFEKEKKDLGDLAGKLLQMLEYRGYDSTGALFQNGEGSTVLMKDVGAPSKIVKALGVDKQGGRSFCGQVRWATFGAVNQENSQPHEVRCKMHFYGAHNGNITNCEQLREWLESEGHNITSDNDGEMLVHTVEHYFVGALSKKDPNSEKDRREALKEAVVKTSKKVVGSFAAVVFDPQTQLMAAVKAGSSLYIGIGHEEKYGSFLLVSSDLGSVLSQTKILLPIAESEFALCTSAEAKIYDLDSGKSKERKPARTRLNIRDTKLQPPYQFFMEQEIFSQGQAAKNLVRIYTGKSSLFDHMRAINTSHPEIIQKVRQLTKETARVLDPKEMKKSFARLVESKAVKTLVSLFGGDINFDRYPPSSTMSGFLDEVRKGLTSVDSKSETALCLMDALFALDDTKDIAQRSLELVEKMVETYKRGRVIYVIACGTSFHAAKTGTLFFNEIAGMQYFPLLPGEFRTQCSASLEEGDMIIGISQSGETKDLIDIFNQVEETGKEIFSAAVVNNVNSSLAQEKAKLCIPLFCGPEIAVPATKSFTNQLLLLYYLALRVMDQLDLEKLKSFEPEHKEHYWDNLFKIPKLIEDTLKTTNESVERVAGHLFLEPSTHILATGMTGIAMEGALKIREVVLNHTQGYDSSEFKHGPNTILGVNTVFGIDSVKAILEKFSNALVEVLKDPGGNGMDAESVHRLYRAIFDYAFNDVRPTDLSEKEKELFKGVFAHHNFFESMYRNYPLIFITGPSERDVNLSISQINTHKIRGANIFVIAEPNSDVLQTTQMAPDTGWEYQFDYIELPQTGDNLLPLFSSTIVLQLLALKMSVKKSCLLDKLEIAEHGVHPDSPKNVSKSITVD